MLMTSLAVLMASLRAFAEMTHVPLGYMLIPFALVALPVFLMTLFETWFDTAKIFFLIIAPMSVTALKPTVAIFTTHGSRRRGPFHRPIIATVATDHLI